MKHKRRTPLRFVTSVAQQDHQKLGSFHFSALASSAYESGPQPCFSLTFVAAATSSQQCPGAEKESLRLFSLFSSWYQTAPKSQTGQTSPNFSWWKCISTNTVILGGILDTSFSTIAYSVCQHSRSVVPSVGPESDRSDHLLHHHLLLDCDHSLLSGALAFILSLQSQHKSVIMPQLY